MSRPPGGSGGAGAGRGPILVNESGRPGPGPFAERAGARLLARSAPRYVPAVAHLHVLSLSLSPAPYLTPLSSFSFSLSLSLSLSLPPSPSIPSRPRPFPHTRPNPGERDRGGPDRPAVARHPARHKDPLSRQSGASIWRAFRCCGGGTWTMAVAWGWWCWRGCQGWCNGSSPTVSCFVLF